MTSAVDGATADRVATIGGLPINVHDHLCVLYRGESQRDELMVDFLAEGVHSGHKCYCMIAPSEQQRIASAVSAVGDDARGGVVEEAGELEFVGPGGSHLAGGRFLSDRMLQFWADWGTATYERAGVQFARIGADMSWAKPLVSEDFVIDLARYESRFNRWSSHHPQVTACMYDLDKFGGDVIVPIITVHPKVWMDGVVLTNPYYMDAPYGDNEGDAQDPGEGPSRG